MTSPRAKDSTDQAALIRCRSQCVPRCSHRSRSFWTPATTCPNSTRQKLMRSGNGTSNRARGSSFSRELARLPAHRIFCGHLKALASHILLHTVDSTYATSLGRAHRESTGNCRGSISFKQSQEFCGPALSRKTLWFEFVSNLLKPGQEPTSYSDDTQEAEENYLKQVVDQYWSKVCGVIFEISR